MSNRKVDALIAAVDELAQWAVARGDWSPACPDSTPWGGVVAACDALRPTVGTVRPSQIGGAPVGVFHPETSVEAAGKVSVGSQETRVLEAVAGTAGMGLTARSVGNLLRMSPNQAGARFVALREKGLIQRLIVRGIVITRKTTGERRGDVHVVTLAGVKELRRLAETDLTARSG